MTCWEGGGTSDLLGWGTSDLLGGTSDLLGGSTVTCWEGPVTCWEGGGTSDLLEGPVTCWEGPVTCWERGGTIDLLGGGTVTCWEREGPVTCWGGTSDLLGGTSDLLGGDHDLLGGTISTSRPRPAPPDVSSFLIFLLAGQAAQTGGQEGSAHRGFAVDVSDAMTTAHAFLNHRLRLQEEDQRPCVLRKAFSSPSFQGYDFVSCLLVLRGLIKSEDKVKPVRVVPGQLQALEHVVRQDYFPRESVAVLEAFMSRNSKALEPVDGARSGLQTTLQGLQGGS
ncbi:unnamed protein product [Arctogadus glacialis]